MKTWQSIALGAAALVAVAAVTPFKVKREENGDFDVRAPLYRLVRKKNDITGRYDYALSAFGLMQKDDEEEEVLDDDELLLLNNED